MQANHKELILTFKYFLSIESALRQKTISAVSVKYITTLRYCNTKFINKTIGIILKHIFDNYGKITPQMLIQCEDVVKQTDFDVDVPIDAVFNDVEELGDISTTDLNPYTKQQYINLAYNIINKNG